MTSSFQTGGRGVEVDERKSGSLTLARVLGIGLGVSLLVQVLLPVAFSTQKAANEANAIASLKNLAIAQEIYRSRRNPPGYAPSLSDLSGLVEAQIVLGAYRGYLFYAGAANADAFSYGCVPAAPGASGDRSFYIDQSGIIRVSAGARASSSSPPLQ